MCLCGICVIGLWVVFLVCELGVGGCLVVGGLGRCCGVVVKLWFFFVLCVVCYLKVDS